MKKSRLSWVVLAVVAGSLGVACHLFLDPDELISGDRADASTSPSPSSDAGPGSGPGSDSGDAANSSSDAPTTDPKVNYVNARCASQKRCLPAQYAAYYATDADCEAADTTSSSSATQQQFDACAAKLATADCAISESDIPECDFKGTGADGTPCRSSGSCASGRCKRDAGAGCGACADPIPAAGACAGGSDCEADLYCGEDGKCDPRIPANGTCPIGSGCQPGLECVSTTCKSPVDIGGPCTGFECRRGLSCIKTKCAEPTYVQPGGTCSNNFSDGISCVRSTCISAKCVPYATLGQPCSYDGTKPSCDPSADTSCSNATNGTCVASAPSVVCN